MVRTGKTIIFPLKSGTIFLILPWKGRIHPFTGGKVRSELEKLSFFHGNQGQFF